MLADYKEYADKGTALPIIETSIRKPDKRGAEAINWFLPVVESIVPFKMERRTTLSYEYVYDTIFPVFKGKNVEILQILYNMNKRGD